jgi:molecular chaperone DnaJ
VTLYDILGVRSDATQAEIRSAYRNAARRHHPDTGDGSTSAMAAAAGAWEVLGNPTKRRQYDLSQRSGVGAADADAWSSTPKTSTASYTSGPYTGQPYTTGGLAKFPWKLMAVMATVGSVVVLIGAITASPIEPQKPDNLLQPNSCVSILANGDAAEVMCDGTQDGVVAQLIPMGSTCPVGSEAHRDRQGMGTACVVIDAASGTG